MRVVIAGGGTAGHVNPAIALALSMAPDEVTFVGTARGAEARLVPAAGFPFHQIDVGGFDRARPLSLVAVGARAARAAGVARDLLRRVRPDVVVGMGGYVSLPVCLAARSRRIPVVVHEQNIVLGLANKVSRRIACRVGVSFEETLREAGPRGVYVGNPVAPHFARFDRAAERPRALATFGLDPGRSTVLVFGGSQGARRLNEAAGGLAEIWADRRDLQVVHITGPAWDAAPPRATGDGLIYRPVAFVERMVDAYAAADLAVCRGGATTVAELTAVGLPAIVVPYPHHRDRQQERHGRALERAGAAVVVLDGELTPPRLGAECDAMLGDPARLQAAAAAARSLSVPDAADRLARVVRECAE